MKYALPLLLLVAACGSHIPRHSITQVQWMSDTVAFQLRSEDGTPAENADLRIQCLSCKLADPALELRTTSDGSVRARIAEAAYLVSTRLRVEYDDWDSVILLTQPIGVEAVRRFSLTRPLLGRVLVDRYAILYADTAQVEIADHVSAGDELNLFSESDAFYLVHHPAFARPLYLLKSNAKRMF